MQKRIGRQGFGQGIALRLRVRPSFVAECVSDELSTHTHTHTHLCRCLLWLRHWDEISWGVQNYVLPMFCFFEFRVCMFWHLRCGFALLFAFAVGCCMICVSIFRIFVASRRLLCIFCIFACPSQNIGGTQSKKNARQCNDPVLET